MRTFNATLPQSGTGDGGEDEMASDETLLQLIKEQLNSFKDQLKDFKDDVRSDISELKEDISDVKSDVESIKKDLGGQGGIRERVTAIEVKVQKAVTNTSSHSVYPPPPSEPKPRSKSIKEHGMALGASAGGAGAVVAIIELIQTFLKTK